MKDSDSDEDDISASDEDDPDYRQEGSADSSSEETESVSSSLEEVENEEALKKRSADSPTTSRLSVTNLGDASTSTISGNKNSVNVSSSCNDKVIWSNVKDDFQPRKYIPPLRDCVILADVNCGSSELQVFLKLFPKSLFMFISQCTNRRLEILESATKKKIPKTDEGEIMIALGCSFVMSYNRLPHFSHYWSSNASLGNEAIKTAISRDRCMLLFSKLYCNEPEKPDSVSKLYYVEEITSCLKTTFQKCRADSAVQSIDESMTKFKGRTVLKQYMPLKPVKRGIKIWLRCDSLTGYTYDFNVYCGKETIHTDGTLGERVVARLAETISNPDTALCFDRFFTSVHLLDTLPYAAVGTVIKTRKNVPKFSDKLEKGDSYALQNTSGTLAVKWHDTKEVLVLSNCHSNIKTTVKRTQKNGTRIDVECPDAIAFYNKFMGGVDIADQMATLYDHDRKSAKWWKKVFYKLLMISAVNAWIVFKEVKGNDIPFLQFLVALAEGMIAFGKGRAHIRRKKSSGRPSKRFKNMLNVGDHLPVEGNSRRRCFHCSTQKIETRTKTLCQMCQLPLCKNCFTPYHT